MAAAIPAFGDLAKSTKGERVLPRRPPHCSRAAKEEKTLTPPSLNTTELLWTGSRGEGVFQFDQRASIETKTADGVVSEEGEARRSTPPCVRGKWVGRRCGRARSPAPAPRHRHGRSGDTAHAVMGGCCARGRRNTEPRARERRLSLLPFFVLDLFFL